MPRPRGTPDLPTLDDPAVPSNALLGPEAHDLLAAAVGAAGGELRSAPVPVGRRLPIGWRLGRHSR